MLRRRRTCCATPYRRPAPDRRDRQGRPRVTGRAPEPGQARSADLCSYFLLRNLDISWRGRVGKKSSIMKADTVYTPSDCCENLPIPEFTVRMDRVGEELHSVRRSVMLGRSLWLTKLYNLVHDPTVTDEEIRRLREIHTEIDYATAQAYGWGDAGPTA